MTLNDFITLDDLTRTETVWNATCLTNHHEGGNRILTYDLGDFCVEVSYSLKAGKILRFRFFRSDLQVDYIGQIDIR